MPTPKRESHTIVMMGATGAVGGEVVRSLEAFPELARLTLLGRRPVENLDHAAVEQHAIDIFDVDSYRAMLPGHQTAICTLGVGQPSTMSKERYERIDKQAVLDFATASKAAGIRHFELLGSIGANAASRSFYLRKKGELQNALQALAFDRLSLFQPSMILTPNNRYGFQQAMTLAIWPRLEFALVGGLRKYRGIPVATLGRAIAVNATQPIDAVPDPVEVLQWDDFMTLASSAR